MSSRSTSPDKMRVIIHRYQSEYTLSVGTRKGPHCPRMRCLGQAELGGGCVRITICMHPVSVPTSFGSLERYLAVLTYTRGIIGTSPSATTDILDNIRIRGTGWWVGQRHRAATASGPRTEWCILTCAACGQGGLCWAPAGCGRLETVICFKLAGGPCPVRAPVRAPDIWHSSLRPDVLQAAPVVLPACLHACALLPVRRTAISCDCGHFAREPESGASPRRSSSASLHRPLPLSPLPPHHDRLPSRTAR